MRRGSGCISVLDQSMRRASGRNRSGGKRKRVRLAVGKRGATLQNGRTLLTVLVSTPVNYVLTKLLIGDII